MSSTHIYLLIGDYPHSYERDEWIVCSYNSKEEAENHVRMINKYIEKCLNGRKWWNLKTEERINISTYMRINLDPFFSNNRLHRVQYSVKEVWNFRHIDEFKENIHLIENRL